MQVGTYLVALAAKAAGVPVYAVSDTFKLSPGPLTSITMPNTQINEGNFTDSMVLLTAF